MTKHLINEQYDVQESDAKRSFGKGDKREDYADAWQDTGNVVLIGLAGSGKAALAELVAERTGMDRLTPESAEEAVSALGMTGKIIVLDDKLVEVPEVQSLIHGSGKVFYLMVDTNLLSTRIAERESLEDREQVWRDMSARLAIMEPIFYSVLYFILQGAMSPEELVEDAMEKIAL